MLKAVGKTEDGKLVIAGIYRFYETTGLPLEVILDGLLDRNCVPDWTSYLKEATDAGMSKERALSALEAAIVDTYGPKIRDVVMARLCT